MTTLVTVELEHVSGLPADRVVNTFHHGQTFDPFVELTAGEITIVGDAIQDFYLGLNGAQVEPISAYLGGQLSRTVAPVMKFYKAVRGVVGPPPPEDESGPPYAIVPMVTNLEPPLNAVEAPSEVAVCLSYHAAPAAGIDPRRMRGRIYLGPLDTGAIADVGAGGAPRPSAEIIADLIAAGTALQAATDDEIETSWCVFSRGPFKVGTSQTPVSRPIVGGHVDNAFDTQRRRGEAPTARSSWGA